MRLYTCIYKRYAPNNVPVLQLWKTDERSYLSKHGFNAATDSFRSQLYVVDHGRKVYELSTMGNSLESDAIGAFVRCSNETGFTWATSYSAWAKMYMCTETVYCTLLKENKWCTNLSEKFILLDWSSNDTVCNLLIADYTKSGGL